MTNLRRQPINGETSDASHRAGLNPSGTAAAQALPPRLWPKRIHRKKYGRWYR